MSGYLMEDLWMKPTLSADATQNHTIAYLLRGGNCAWVRPFGYTTVSTWSSSSACAGTGADHATFLALVSYLLR